MNDYISLRINSTPNNEDITDLLAAYLADYGYESFEPDATGLTAYVKIEDFNEENIGNLIQDFPIECDLEASWEKIEGRDWNEEWEKNYFQPIVIGKRCVVHSTFHTDIPEAEYDISVDPKMAFGTGHHSTTRLMMSELLDMDLKGKRVIDMGTGTGILAILAGMKGAEFLHAVEIDPMAAENAADNFRLNSMDVDLHVGDVASLADIPQADLFLANINRNIILSDLENYALSMVNGGEILLSGFFSKDADMIIKMGRMYSLTLKDKKNDGEWAMLHLVKS